MKCKHCDGTGEYEPFDLDVELDKLYPTEQTEREYIQTCNTEQLAEFLKKVSNYEGICTVCTGKCVAGKCIYSVGKQGWVEWLKQPRTKE